MNIEVEVFDLVRSANQGEVEGASSAIIEMLGLVGLVSLADAPSGDGPDVDATALLEQREDARAEKDFVRDSPEGASLVPISGS